MHTFSTRSGLVLPSGAEPQQTPMSTQSSIQAASTGAGRIMHCNTLEHAPKPLQVQETYDRIQAAALSTNKHHSDAWTRPPHRLHIEQFAQGPAGSVTARQWL